MANVSEFLWRAAGRFWLVVAVTLLSACGGGGGSAAGNPPVAAAEEGEVLIGLTDAQGDYLSYVVDVDSLLLEKANGTTVETLPLSTRVDFSELTEVTEFLTVATVPVGNYTSVVLHLDFSDAEIVVQDPLGEAVAARPQDIHGEPIAEFSVRLQLTTADVIRVSPGVPAAFSLDFDLDASNEIEFTDTGAVVTVEPFLLAVPELEADRRHRVRGALADVNEPDNEITLKVRPFHHRSGDFGRFTFAVNDATTYEINGESYTGASGLVAMAELPENTPVVGGISVADGGHVANTLLAGTSVPWTDGDVVKGVVAARDGDSLTVRGARVEFADGAHVFRGSFNVLVGEDTAVSALGAPSDSLSANSISVGQRVVVFGELQDDLTMDATQGRVRLVINQLTAEVVQASPLAVDLFFLNGRRPAAFDFSGTGVSQADDADPDFYEVDTGLLSLNSVANGDLIRVRGLVNDFAMAPQDYNARTVIDVQTDMRGASLKVGWPYGTSVPFQTLSGERIDLDLQAARAALKVKGVPVEFTNPVPALALIAPDSGHGAYAVIVRGAGEAHLFRSFADLVDELNAQLDAGNLLHRIGAHGRYNSATDELTTGRASFVFQGQMPIES